MSTIKLSCPFRDFHVEMELPTSKSISNRLLIMKALANDKIELKSISTANDTSLLQDLLTKDLHSDFQKQELNTQDAGTVYRFLTAFLSIGKGEYTLNGNTRMQQRPIRVLVDALRHLGADIKYLNKEGYPPLLINGKDLASNNLTIDAHISSQYITAILLISPYLPEGLKIQLNKTVSSLPYIDMTIKLMQDFGISVQRIAQSVIIEKGKYKGLVYETESDWSAAAFWYQCVAFSNNASIFMKGLKKNSIQGDAVLPSIFEQLGVKTSFQNDGVLIEKSSVINHNISLDFNNYPDIAMSVINTCAGLGVIGKFSGLKSLKIKESNRIAVLESELSKLGFDFRETDENEWVLINSCKIKETEYDFSAVTIQTHEDHRVAMSFAPFAVLGKGINIKDALVVKKSYPNFWKEFNKLSIFA
ncbi:MAG: 3-phosphoshikimate 1-carboxyvinyltransferase [Bacteroidales bacterium]|nr:3-phosphoshikimate 1-carboxyvinyltransferase [Bacteroidales bacterium]